MLVLVVKTWFRSVGMCYPVTSINFVAEIMADGRTTNTEKNTCESIEVNPLDKVLDFEIFVRENVFVFVQCVCCVRYVALQTARFYAN